MSEFIYPKYGNNKFCKRFHKENVLNDVKFGNNNIIFRYRYRDGILNLIMEKMNIGKDA